MKKLTTNEVMTVALVAVRDALQCQARALRSIPGTTRFADEIDKNVDAIDFATAALASQVGFPTYAGGGGAVSPDVAAKVATWVSRGKRDPFDDEPAEPKASRLGAALGKSRAD